MGKDQKPRGRQCLLVCVKEWMDEGEDGEIDERIEAEFVH